MGTVGFYIPESEKYIEDHLRNLSGGDRSKYIIDCIKRSSLSIINEQIKSAEVSLEIWRDMLNAHTNPIPTKSDMNSDVGSSAEEWIENIIMEQIQIRNPNTFRIWISSKSNSKKLKKYGIDLEFLLSRFADAYEKKREDDLHRMEEEHKKWKESKNRNKRRDAE